MIRQSIVSGVVTAAACIASPASAGWFQGQPIIVNGSFTELEQPPAHWGTWSAQGLHDLGGMSHYVAPIKGGSLVMVSSTVLSPTALSLVIDYSEFPFFEIGHHEVVLPDLKAPGALLQASSNVGQISVQGTSVTWSAQALDIPQDGEVKILIEQIPTPGALALVGLAAVGARRRRN